MVTKTWDDGIGREKWGTGTRSSAEEVKKGEMSCTWSGICQCVFRTAWNKPSTPLFGLGVLSVLALLISYSGAMVAVSLLSLLTEPRRCHLARIFAVSPPILRFTRIITIHVAIVPFVRGLHPPLLARCLRAALAIVTTYSTVAHTVSTTSRRFSRLQASKPNPPGPACPKACPVLRFVETETALRLDSLNGFVQSFLIPPIQLSGDTVRTSLFVLYAVPTFISRAVRLFPGGRVTLLSFHAPGISKYLSVTHCPLDDMGGDHRHLLHHRTRFLFEPPSHSLEVYDSLFGNEKPIYQWGQDVPWLRV
jgi:hypothetical protein